jgi:hypothetical protein
MICRWIEEGPESVAFKSHVDKIRDFMWMSAGGMMMCGKSCSLIIACALVLMIGWTQERMEVNSGTPRSSRKLWSKPNSEHSPRTVPAPRPCPFPLPRSLLTRDLQTSPRMARPMSNPLESQAS